MITKDELGSWLWGAADILRGAVSAEDYGEFILPLLFYKRLSDVYSIEYGKKLKEYGDKQVAKDSMFYRAIIPDGCLWDDVRKTAVNVGAKLNNVLSQIAKANPRLDRVINRTDFNNPNAIPEERLVRLIEHFNQKDLSNSNVSPDILVDHGAKTTRKWIGELTTDLVSKGFTVLAVINPEMHTPEQIGAVLDLFDGEVSITQTGDPQECKKSLRVKKLRNQDYIKNPICLANPIKS